MSRTEERIAQVAAAWQEPAELPDVLAQVRKDRAAGVHTTPSSLYHLADENAELYFHALIEGGHILSAPDGPPYMVCPICGHEFA